MALFFAAQFLVTASSQELSYALKNGQKFSYEMEITADTGNEFITYNGVIHYTVTGVNPQQANVTYRGGLAESKKVTRRTNNRFGPRGFGPPDFPSPFSRPSFTGKTQTTNRLVITPRGGILAMEGDSQLPYLIGNVSILPFEPLPKGAQRQWESDGGVSITEESDGGRGPFGRFGPMGRSAIGSPKNVQAASEISTYAIEKTDGDLVVIRKNYRLNAPQTEDNEGFEMNGSGTWTFNSKDHVPQSSDMKISLTVSTSNTQTTIPITIRYDRLSSERLAEMEAEAAKRAEEMKRAAAEKKTRSEAPLTAEEKKQTLADLASGNDVTLVRTLNALAAKSLADPDPEIVAAIAAHLESSNRAVASAAGRAMSKWSPEFAKQQRLKKEYEGPGAIKSTELYVESTTPLFIGQIVQAQHPRRGSFWRAAKVKQLLPDGKVELAFLQWGKERDVETVGRRNIQLAPPELEQPARPSSARSGVSSSRPMNTGDASAASSKSKVRKWTDATGRFSVDASFHALEGDKVRLLRTDGRTMSISLSKLSEADRRYVDELQQAENPFQFD